MTNTTAQVRINKELVGKFHHFKSGINANGRFYVMPLAPNGSTVIENAIETFATEDEQIAYTKALQRTVPQPVEVVTDAEMDAEMDAQADDDS